MLGPHISTTLVQRQMRSIQFSPTNRPFLTGATMETPAATGESSRSQLNPKIRLTISYLGITSTVVSSNASSDRSTTTAAV